MYLYKRNAQLMRHLSALDSQIILAFHKLLASSHRKVRVVSEYLTLSLIGDHSSATHGPKLIGNLSGGFLSQNTNKAKSNLILCRGDGSLPLRSMALENNSNGPRIFFGYPPWTQTSIFSSSRQCIGRTLDLQYAWLMKGGLGGGSITQSYCV